MNGDKIVAFMNIEVVSETLTFDSNIQLNKDMIIISHHRDE
jgi:hypothetical protein